MNQMSTPRYPEKIIVASRTKGMSTVCPTIPTRQSVDEGLKGREYETKEEEKPYKLSNAWQQPSGDTDQAGRG